MITGWEWIVIVLIVLAILLWGPAKLPELARAVGLARREFEKASKDAEGLIRISGAATVAEEDVLIKTAKRLGISTEGKTKEQISQEIVQKARETKDLK